MKQLVAVREIFTSRRGTIQTSFFKSILNIAFSLHLVGYFKCQRWVQCGTSDFHARLKLELTI